VNILGVGASEREERNMGFEDFLAVVLEISICWNTKPCSPVKVS
jgi:hypothetical protein